MEYNLHRDFNASFAIDFKRYTTTSDLQDAVDRYITSQGNQAGLQNLAEILYNMAFNYTPSIAHDLMPQIIGIVKQNGSQAGMQGVKPVLNAIFEEALTGMPWPSARTWWRSSWSRTILRRAFRFSTRLTEKPRASLSGGS